MDVKFTQVDATNFAINEYNSKHNAYVWAQVTRIFFSLLIIVALVLIVIDRVIINRKVKDLETGVKKEKGAYYGDWKWMYTAGGYGLAAVSVVALLFTGIIGWSNNPRKKLNNTIREAMREGGLKME